MKNEQMTLFPDEPELKPYTSYQKKKWFKKFSQYCQKIYDKEGSTNGTYCCGYHWCCDECSMKLCNGCADCVQTIKTILKRYGIAIDYNDYDFSKWEELAMKVYYKAKGWKL